MLPSRTNLAPGIPCCIFLQPVPWEKSDCSFTNFREVTNGAECYLAQKAPGEALAGHARGTTSAWLQGCQLWISTELGGLRD